MNARYQSHLLVLAALGLPAILGCTQQVGVSAGPDDLRGRSFEALRRGLAYKPLAVVRVQAIEALEREGGERALPRLRHALDDEVPAVRFAGLMALGNRADAVARRRIEELAASAITSDRLAAIFALHRLGDTSRTAQLAEALMNHADPEGRRHAAMILGRLGEPGAIKLLARTMRQSDPALTANALEAMYLLGAREAQATLYADAYSGIGSEETFAITVLGERPNKELKDLYVHKLVNAFHLETKLAAARALGRLGDRRGYPVAAEALAFTATEDNPNDSASNQTLRVRTIAAIALGDIDEQDALPALAEMMNSADDPRLQIAAAAAILRIMGPASKRRLPFQ